MYKVLHQPSRQEIIILDARWIQQIEYLRNLDKQDALVCPRCEQPVRVRAGKIKRWHFAHKHLANCPFEKESLILLKTRAVLYSWLTGKFEIDQVTIEKQLSELPFQRHVDCWVKRDDHQIAYWIFDRRVPPDERAKLKSGFKEIGVPVVWVFVSDLLRVDFLGMQDRLHLTTTERAFICNTEFDRAWQTHFEHLGGSLHYLDADQETITTYRNLTVVHMPQLYRGKRLEHPIAEILISPETGEFVHPGEIGQLEKREREIVRQQTEVEQRLRLAKDFFSRTPSQKNHLPQEEVPPPNSQPFERSGTCRFCGTETTDWITYFGDTQECICRNCKDQANPR